MDRKNDLLAIALLMFSAILVAAMATDPKGFSLQAWQPLIAAVIALGGAGIVFRGATLAYSAAMAKVALDERIHETEVRRKRRGILLRLDYNLFLMWQDANRLKSELNQPSGIFGPAEKAVSKDTIKFTLRELEEAWTNLDLFREPVARAIGQVKICLINFDHAMAHVTDADLQLKSGYMPPPSAAMKDLREALEEIGKNAKFIRDNLDTD